MHRFRKLGALSFAVLSLLVLATPALAFTYPTAVNKAFVSTCVKSGGTKKTCTCVIKYLEKRESLHEFEAMANKYQGGLSPLEKKAIKVCV